MTRCDLLSLAGEYESKADEIAALERQARDPALDLGGRIAILRALGAARVSEWLGSRSLHLALYEHRWGEGLPFAAADGATYSDALGDVVEIVASQHRKRAAACREQADEIEEIHAA